MAHFTRCGPDVVPQFFIARAAQLNAAENAVALDSLVAIRRQYSDARQSGRNSSTIVHDLEHAHIMAHQTGGGKNLRSVIQPDPMLDRWDLP